MKAMHVREALASVCLAVAAIAGGAAASGEPGGGAGGTDDLTVIRSRLIEHMVSTTPDAGKIKGHLAGLKPDGSWPDVDYRDRSTTLWKPAEHLHRMRAMAKAWCAPDSPTRGSADLLRSINLALDFWLQRDLQLEWWWKTIGTPLFLSETLLILDDKLTPEQRRKGTAILERAKLGYTGANFLWVAEITARRAILNRDRVLMGQVFPRIWADVKPRTGEGLQHDFTFHQHGAVLYNHGYGVTQADTARLAAMAAGTAFACPEDRVKVLAGAFLDGSQWLALGRHSDFGAEGREITRRGQSAAYLGQAAQHLLGVPTGRERELREMAERVAGKPGAPPLTGNRHFHRSDIMVHHRPGWYMSARMYSVRTMNTDNLAGCDEGRLSHYLAEGATCIMRHGQEYFDVFPAWDWQRVPGTTVELAPHRPGAPERRGESAFAGGASDGAIGVAAFQLRRGALAARKAWFFCSDVAVCLGTDIRCQSEHGVVTTLNQCRLKGPVLRGADTGAAETVEEGARACHARWVWHDGIGYVFDKATQVELANVPRTGSWKRISGQSSGEPVTEKVFTLGLNHGVRPDGADYHYAVYPGIEADAAAALVRKPAYVVAENSAKVQAVHHPGDSMLGVVFHQAGAFDWQGWRATVDRPCVLAIRRTPAGWQAAVAHPAAEAGRLQLEVSGPGCRLKTTVELPKGPLAGSTTLVRM